MGIGLDASLSIATSGLAAVQAQIAVVSQNVANASTPGYAEEVAPSVSVVAAGEPSGVRLGNTTLITAPALQAALWSQNAAVGAGNTTSAALSTVSDALGSTDSTSGSTGSLSSALSTLGSDFTALGSDPSSSAAQDTVVADAQALAAGVQNLAATYATVRQSASNDIAATVGSINADLASIGSLSDQIVGLQAQGMNTADLVNQRNAVMTTLSSVLGVKFGAEADGGMLVSTASGLTLPTNSTTGPLFYSSPTLGPGDAYVAGASTSTIPGITMDGQDVTGSLTGGKLGADITLRDDTLPTDMAELDSYAATVAQRFAAQGLTLFTDAGGNVPADAAASTGFSTVMQVNPAVLNSAALVRDGTNDIAGSPGGASAFAVNPAGGPSGFSTLIDRVLTYTFGDEVASGVAQPSIATSGLGATGALSLPYGGTGSLSDFAANLVAAQGQDAADASDSLSSATATATALQTSIGSVSGVSVDSEMSKMTALENSYTANAKVIAAVQAMYTDLLDAIDTTT